MLLVGVWVDCGKGQRVDFRHVVVEFVGGRRFFRVAMVKVVFRIVCFSVGDSC